MSKYNQSTNRGFIALISVIIISAVLMIIATTLGFSSFFGRYNILDSELKERSSALADACVDVALLKLVNNPTYSSSVSELVNIDLDTCNITNISPGYPKTIKVTSDYKNFVTNLEVVVASSDLVISSWEEVPSS